MEVCITIFGIHFQCSCSEFALLQIESFIIRLAALWQLSNKSLYSSPSAFTKSDTDPSKLFLFFKLPIIAHMTAIHNNGPGWFAIVISLMDQPFRTILQSHPKTRPAENMQNTYSTYYTTVMSLLFTIMLMTQDTIAELLIISCFYLTPEWLSIIIWKGIPSRGLVNCSAMYTFEL